MSTSSIKLNDEQIDDLLYCARAGEVEDLAAYLDELVPSSSEDVVNGKQAVLAQVQDGSGNGMFHYVGANGHLGEQTSGMRINKTFSRLSKQLC